MIVTPKIQAEFERNLLWERSWPKCLLVVIATVEIILGLVILATEVFNILVDFWYTNIFGGVWSSIILITNWILIFVHVCCTTTVRASTCSFIWHWITLIALMVLIPFDIVFILNPYTCLLTSTCSTQTKLTSCNYIVQKIPQFANYTIYDSKKLFLEIQVGCAGLAFLLTVVYIIIFIVCRVKFGKLVTEEYPQIEVATSRRGLRVGPAPTVPLPISLYGSKNSSN